MSEKQILDRHGIQLVVGMKLRICHCTGPYGKVTTDEGVIQEIDCYLGARLELLKPTRWESRDGVKHLNVGDQLYISLPGRWDLAANAYVCDKVHHDFEHGHHAWAEVFE